MPEERKTISSPSHQFFTHEAIRVFFSKFLNSPFSIPLPSEADIPSEVKRRIIQLLEPKFPGHCLISSQILQQLPKAGFIFPKYILMACSQLPTLLFFGNCSPLFFFETLVSLQPCLFSSFYKYPSTPKCWKNVSKKEFIVFLDQVTSYLVTNFFLDPNTAGHSHLPSPDVKRVLLQLIHGVLGLIRHTADFTTSNHSSYTLCP